MIFFLVPEIHKTTLFNQEMLNLSSFSRTSFHIFNLSLKHSKCKRQILSIFLFFFSSALMNVETISNNVIEDFKGVDL